MDGKATKKDKKREMHGIETLINESKQNIRFPREACQNFSQIDPSKVHSFSFIQDSGPKGMRRRGGVLSFGTPQSADTLTVLVLRTTSRHKEVVQPLRARYQCKCCATGEFCLTQGKLDCGFALALVVETLHTI